MAAATRVKVTFRLSIGTEFTAEFHVDPSVVSPTDPIVTAIVAAINTLTGGWGFRIELSAVGTHAVTPTASSIYVNEDKGEFVFVGDGLASTFKLPAIKHTLVGTDTINIPISGSGAVHDFVTAVAANALTPGAGALSPPTFGTRRTARKTLKK